MRLGLLIVIKQFSSTLKSLPTSYPVMFIGIGTQRFIKEHKYGTNNHVLSWAGEVLLTGGGAGRVTYIKLASHPRGVPTPCY